MAAFVTFEDVSKVYHSGEIEIRAVDHISFTIEKGEFCVIVGPSGAGKTTVLNMLGGMDACSGGTITVDGTLVSGFNARQLTTYRRHDIGFVFQFYNLVGNLTALVNAMVFPKMLMMFYFLNKPMVGFSISMVMPYAMASASRIIKPKIR